MRINLTFQQRDNPYAAFVSIKGIVSLSVCSYKTYRTTTGIMCTVHSFSFRFLYTSVLIKYIISNIFCRVLRNFLFIYYSFVSAPPKILYPKQYLFTIYYVVQWDLFGALYVRINGYS